MTRWIDRPPLWLIGLLLVMSVLYLTLPDDAALIVLLLFALIAIPAWLFGFSIPVLASTFIGAVLGCLVCIVVDPAIRSIVSTVSARRPLCRNPDAQPLRFGLH